MPRVATVRKADLDRVLKALTDRGLTVARVEVTPAGVNIIPGALTVTSVAPLTPLEQFRAERAKRVGRAD